MYRRPYLDANVYLAVFAGEEGRAEVGRLILSAAERGEVRLIASTLVLAEVAGRDTTPADLVARERIDAYFERDLFEWVEIDYPLAVTARALVREHRLSGADAVHVAAALRAGADVFLTWEHKIRDRAQSVGIPVLEPYWSGPQTLPGAGATTVTTEEAPTGPHDDESEEQ